MPELVLVHLSDIHFKHATAGGAWDLDRDLRDELEIDLRALMDRLGGAQAILVTGDIAFSGSTEEYEQASTWLETIVNIVGCRERDVWMVPGNHDVIRDTVKSSHSIQEFHQLLRTCS